jgi:ARC6-like, IMS domain
MFISVTMQRTLLATFRTSTDAIVLYRYFEYSIKNLEVNSVINLQGGRTAKIMATIKEEVKLYSSPGKIHDQDVATYTTEFQAQRSKDGLWRISDSNITGVRR